MEEKTRRTNFVRVAERRVNEIVSLVQSLRRLTNKSFYKYDEDDVKRIFNVIETELKATKRVFYKGKNERFKL